MVNVITALRIYALYGRARRGELLDFGSNTLALVLTRSESPLSHVTLWVLQSTVRIRWGLKVTVREG